MKHEIIISIHIPKTGGVTFKNILQKVYGSSLYYINQSTSVASAANQICEIEWYKTRAIHGHFPYGIHEYFPRNISYRYITFLRHPGERLLSEYNYLLEHNYMKIPKILDWIRYNKYYSAVNIDNNITRNLNGKLEINTYLGVVNKVSDDDYLLALENLRKFFFVGTTETFDSDIKLLSKLLDWEDIGEYKNSNVSTNKKHFSDLSEKVQKVIFETQQYDFKLWEDTKEIHSELIK